MLNELATQWKEQKAALKAAQESLLQTEIAIYDLVKNDLREKGITHFEHGLDVTTGFTESWDEDAVSVAYNAWPQGVPFPFKGMWKPDAKALSVVKDHSPEAYRLLQEALTVKPKKPSFNVK